jgi:hypothetical protein
MDPHHVDALIEAVEKKRQRARQPLLGVGDAGRASDKALARSAQEHPDANPLVERYGVQNSPIVLVGLAEADAGIDQDRAARNSGGKRRRNTRIEMIEGSS